jgi:hypothetical protein
VHALRRRGSRSRPRRATSASPGRRAIPALALVGRFPPSRSSGNSCPPAGARMQRFIVAAGPSLERTHESCAQAAGG